MDSLGQLSDESSIFPFDHTTVNHIYEDESGNIWIATYGFGLYCIKNNGIQHVHLKKGVLHNNINGLYFWEKMYATSLGALAIFEKGEMKNPFSHKVDYNQYFYFVKHFNGQLLLGTPDRLISGRILVDSKLSCLDTIPMINGALCSEQDVDSNIWIGQFEGIAQFEHGVMTPFDDPAINQQRVNVIYKVPSNNRLFFGTDNGLYTLTSTGVKQTRTWQNGQSNIVGFTSRRQQRLALGGHTSRALHIPWRLYPFTSR